MEIKVQLWSFLYAFAGGLLFYILSYFNYKIIKKYNTVWKYIITIIFVIDFDLIFLLGLYIINDGILHIYFLITLVLSFLLSVKFMPIMKYRIKKRFKKCYNKNNRRL